MKTIVSISFGLLVCVFGLRAQDVSVIPFQGQLTDQSGQPLTPSSPVTIVFRLYQTPVGAPAIWEEAQPNISVSTGRFSVLLGSRSPLPGYTNFNATLYLGLTVDDGDPQTTDVEMRPRQALVPVISATYAKQAQNADTLAGFDWSALFGINNPQGNMLGSRIAPGTIGSNQIGADAISPAQIAPAAVTGTKIALSSITDAHLADATITAAKLSAQLVLDALNPPGTIVAFGGTEVPEGWLLCDGREVFRTGETERLFHSIGTAWGDGNGSTTFNVPDLRGYFLRGVDHEAGRDPDRASRTAIGEGGNSGHKVGSAQPDAFQGHWHDLWGDNDSWGFANSGFRPYRAEGSDIDRPPYVRHVRSPISDGQSGNPRTASETRPKNAYVNYIIKS